MKALLAAAITGAALLMSSHAFGAEQTVRLGISNFSCIACAFIVKQTLAGVDGVRTVKVSSRQKTAVVTFEDGETNVAALLAATSKVGFPTKVLEE